MVVTRFSKNKITFVLLNYVFVALIRGPFQINFKVRIGVFLNSETDFGFDNSFSLTKYRIRASCQQFGLFMA